jgi:pyruvate dehydrogenase E1 component alpha subunit
MQSIRTTTRSLRLAQAAFTRAAYSTEASFDFEPCKLHKLEEGSIPTTGTLEKDQAMFYLEKMMTIRRMETVAGELYRGKKIRGFCHLYSGQEAVACGMHAAMDENDAFTSAYRVHGWAHLLGASVEEVIGELTGRHCGMSKGKGGSMHMYGENFYGGNGIVGAQVPLGAGIALANKYLDNKTISIAAYGDGASNQGQVFEAYNIAKLWDLPVIFVCENNHYGMGTSSERSSASNKYYTRGDYVPGIWVDGMDFVAVKEATTYARDYVLNHGPIVMEMETYRYHGHSMSDPDTTYRSREEKEKTRKTRDPILLLSQKIETSGWATAAEIKALEKSVRKAVKAEADTALAAPEPPMELLGAHIYSGDQPSSIRGCDVTLEISPNV